MRILFCLLGIWSVFFSIASYAQQSPSPSAEVSASPMWNFENADIRTVIAAVSKETGKKFIIDPRVQGKVTFISHTPMNNDEVYQVFLAILQAHGFSAISESGNVIKIVPDTVAKYHNVPLLNSDVNTPQGSEVVVKVIPVRNGTAEQFVGLLRPLLPTSSELSAYAPTNSLIISSTANKIVEIEKIIQSLDVPSAGAVEIVPVHYADANELASTLKSILPPAPTGKTPTAIAADANSNSILISGSAQDRENIRALIKKMDELTVQTTKMNSAVVVHLRYLNAADFAPVLQNVAQGMSSTPQTMGAASVGASDNNSAQAVAQTPTNAIRALFGATKSNKNSASSVVASSSADLSGLSIQAEPATNSLIIDGSPAQVRALKNIIMQLDKKPQQVLVEAFIAEVNEKTAQKLGIQWGTLPPSGQALTPLPTDQTFATITGGLGLGIVEIGRVKSLITAIKDDGATNVLSTPSLVVLDNQEASLKVGQKASFSTGELVNTASQSTVVNATEDRDVSLQLKVTPQISRGDAIRLKIEHQNDVLTTKIQNGNPIVNDSQFSTSVLINSGQILVIGGLMTNDTEEGVRKVPLLGSIPGVGRLFQYRDDSVTKKNLLIFLRPIVLHNDHVANAQTFSRYSMIRGLQLDRQQDSDILLPQGANNAVLPKWSDKSLPEPFVAHHS